MEQRRFGVWARRVAVGLAIVLFVVAVGVVWRTTNIIESEFLSPGSLTADVSLDVLGVAGSRITLSDAPGAEVDGVWGIVGPNGYGQISSVTARRAGAVERSLAVLSGTIDQGDTVDLDAFAFPDDPRTAHGIPFEEVRVPGELGVNPAWLVAGTTDTWVIFVHGKHENARAQSLRALPTFRKLGLPTLVITYRNDGSGGAGDDGRSSWGLDEWRDVDAALETATLRGAKDFVLVGFDMGASIVAMFLEQSEHTGQVRGVVFDSPLLDLESLVDEATAERNIPGYLSSLGKAIARIRFGLEWSRLDLLDRVGEFDPDIPILLMHGTADEIVSIDRIDAFASALPQVTYERFTGAGHDALWNSEPVHYEDVLTEYLVGILPELAPEE